MYKKGMKEIRDDKVKAFIFDLDDTLLECNENYKKILASFIKELVYSFETPVPSPKEVADKQYEIDINLIEGYGYDKKRFPMSFVETYKYFRKKYLPEEDDNEELIKKFYEIGYSIYNIIPNAKPNAKNILDRCRDQDIKIYLLTAGETKPQKYKINNTFIKDYFDYENIFINIQKDKKEFETIIKKIKADIPGIQNDEITMIGDSIRHDILPALDLGLNAIKLNVNSWNFNHVDLKEKKYIECKDLYILEKKLFL